MTARSDLAALIQRVEAAEADHQAPWLKRAIDAAWNARMISDAVWHRAEEYLRAGAYLDAAASLVPGGEAFMLMRHENGYYYAEVGCGFQVHAATPALALCAAAVRRAAGGGE